MKTDNIVIVGGGSAGWMTAAILIKSFPEKNITLIESPDIPKIGVGESTYEGINLYLEYLGIDRKSFFIHTDATVKLAIQFRDFYKKENHHDFIYPFGLPEISGTLWGLQDWLIKKYCYPETPLNDYVESYFPAAHYVNNNTMPKENVLTDRFDEIYSTALHFDAIKFANWLKNNFAIPRGVKNILANVELVNENSKGVESLVLDNGKKIRADLYIDCTGFQSLLLEKTLKERFISYNDVLPNTHAWATQINYKNKDVEIENVTRCTALKNGWCWNIPLWSRIGSGYVYSSHYVSHENALIEFKDYLKKHLKITRSEEEINSLNFKNIEMRVGIHERVWSKNVVAIGLSAGFIEPLESNGLFSVHEFLFELIRAMERESVTQWDKDVFNYSVKKKFDEFVDFIRLHYALSIREDSEYWISNSQRSYNFEKMLKKNLENNHLSIVQKIKTKTFIPPETGGITWITTGMNYLLADRVALSLGEMYNRADYKKDMDIFFKNLNKKRNAWEKEAKNGISVFEYLEKKFYKYK
jgi:hypothetical protein